MRTSATSLSSLHTQHKNLSKKIKKLKITFDACTHARGRTHTQTYKDTHKLTSPYPLPPEREGKRKSRWESIVREQRERVCVWERVCGTQEAMHIHSGSHVCTHTQLHARGRALLQHTHTRRDESVGCFSSNPDHRFFPLQSQHGQCACANTHLSRACAVPYGRCFYQRLLGLAWNLGPTSHPLLHVTPLRTSRRSCTSRPPQASLRHSNPHTWRPLGAKISFQEQTP